jgi:putative membrane protein
MANERTFLSWIRTSIGIMAFGFVIEKFGLFLEQLSIYLGKEQSPLINILSQNTTGSSSVFGLFIVLLGMLLSILAFVKYKTVEQQIENETYHPSLILDIMLILAVLVIGLFLMLYLFFRV